MQKLSFLLVIAVGLGSQGCAVGMAMNGTKDPDLTVLQEGASRAEVELQLGPALSDITLPIGNHYCTYEYSLGNEPSAGRTVGHVFLDVLTVGLWEIVGTPIEMAAANTEDFTVTVEYGPDMKLRQVLPSYTPGPAIKEDETLVVAAEQRNRLPE